MQEFQVMLQLMYFFIIPCCQEWKAIGIMWNPEALVCFKCYFPAQSDSVVPLNTQFSNSLNRTVLMSSGEILKQTFGLTGLEQCLWSCHRISDAYGWAAEIFCFLLWTLLPIPTSDPPLWLTIISFVCPQSSSLFTVIGICHSDFWDLLLFACVEIWIHMRWYPCLLALLNAYGPLERWMPKEYCLIYHMSAFIFYISIKVEKKCHSTLLLELLAPKAGIFHHNF